MNFPRLPVGVTKLFSSRLCPLVLPAVAGVYIGLPVTQPARGSHLCRGMGAGVQLLVLTRLQTSRGHKFIVSYTFVACMFGASE